MAKRGITGTWCAIVAETSPWLGAGRDFGRGAALALALAACGGPSDAPPSPVEEGFWGAVAGVEPRAILVARDALVAGGGAVDAAVAYYFAAAVTYPSGASLGAGGTCVVYDVGANQAEALEFLSPAGTSSAGQRAVAVPALARGMYALHSRYGRLPFAQLLAPAEALARFGHRVSRAFAADVAEAGPAIAAEPSLAKVFGGIEEGSDLMQPELAATITQVRTRGVGDFYTGGLARRLVEDAEAAGTDLTFEALAGFSPVWRTAADLQIGYALAHVPPPPVTAAASTLVQFAMIAAAGGVAGASAGDRAHLLAETGLRALADRTAWASDGSSPPLDSAQAEALMAGYRAEATTDPAALPTQPAPAHENPTGAGFVAVDNRGSAVACVVTMNNLFGSARFASTTGVLLAAARPPGPISLVPVIVANHNSREVLFAGAAAGGVAAPAVMAQVLADVFDGGVALDDAIRAPRLVNLGNPNLVVPEPDLPDSVVADLQRRGHHLSAPFGLGRVDAIYCSDGLRSRPDTCAAVTDRRGYGMAVGG